METQKVLWNSGRTIWNHLWLVTLWWTFKVVSYNSMISACEKGGEWERALIFFRSVWIATLSPTLVTYSATISALEKCGSLVLSMKGEITLKRKVVIQWTYIYIYTHIISIFVDPKKGMIPLDFAIILLDWQKSTTQVAFGRVHYLY